MPRFLYKPKSAPYNCFLCLHLKSEFSGFYFDSLRSILNEAEVVYVEKWIPAHILGITGSDKFIVVNDV